MTSHSHPLVLTPDSLTYLKLSLVAMIWGGTFVAGRYLSADTPALLAASVRFIFAGITLGLFLGFFLKKSFVRLDRSRLVKIVGLGFCGIYTYLCNPEKGLTTNQKHYEQLRNRFHCHAGAVRCPGTGGR